MTPKQHYQEAEELLRYVEEDALKDGVPLDPTEEARIVARAQVHATLAQATGPIHPVLGGHGCCCATGFVRGASPSRGRLVAGDDA